MYVNPPYTLIMAKPNQTPSLGLLLRKLRLQAGDGIKTAAPKLDVDYSYLSKIENGVANPSADFLSRVAACYGVDVDTLFLSASRLPPDVEGIIESQPRDVIALLRAHFGTSRLDPG